MNSKKLKKIASKMHQRCIMKGNIIRWGCCCRCLSQSGAFESVSDRMLPKSKAFEKA